MHGVSGTTPEALLDRHEVQQVAGNAIAGFYRPTLPELQTDDAPNIFAHKQKRAPDLEGYNWGGLTSGSAGRALWLVLLPFTLANLIPRARPLITSRLGTWLIWYLSRVLALALTALMVLAAAGVGQDLIGWQCLSSGRCGKANPHWAFGPVFGTWTAGTRHGGVSLGIALVTGTLVPALVLFALWFVSGRTLNQYESIGPNVERERYEPGARPDPDLDALEVNLDSPWMWSNQSQIRRLRAAHVQVGIAVIEWTLLGPSQTSWDAGRTRPELLHWSSVGPLLRFELRTHWWSLVPIAIALYSLTCLALPRFVGRNDGRAFRRLSGLCWLVLFVTGVGQLVRLIWGHYVLSAYLTAQRVPDQARGLPGFGASLLGFFLFTMVVLVLLCLVIGVLALRAPGRLTARDVPGAHVDQQPLKPGAWGLVGCVFAVFATMLAAVFSAGAYLFGAAWLSTGSVKPGLSEVTRTVATFRIPEAARAASLAYVVAAVFAVLVLGGFLIWFLVRYFAFGGRLASIAAAPSRDYAAMRSPGPARSKRASKIRRDMFLGQLVDRGPVPLGLLGLGGFGLGLFFALLLFSHHVLHAAWATTLTGRLIPPVRQLSGFDFKQQLTGLGAYLAVLTVLGLVALGAAAFRVPATRKTVGILWDIASFWPRAGHPLAAPCYAERTVPDLVTRIDYHRRIQQRPVLVLAAHSQGCVISSAAIFHLTICAPHGPADLSGVRLLTFGNVTRRLYGRYFPVYFGPQRLHDLQKILTAPNETRPGWINLWRYTDYLGGQLTAGPAPSVPAADVVTSYVTGPASWEWHAPDPPTFDLPDGDTTYAVAHRHSDFWSDQSGYFRQAVHDLIYRRPS